MKRVEVLDCTLRDGGYCNDWKFGKENTKKIVNGLLAANIDYIECGFLTNRVDYVPDKTKFTDLNQISEIFSEKNNSKQRLLMINYGEYSVERIPECKNSSVGGIRVAFHKKDLDKAIRFCGQIKKKGYCVFVQPMVSMIYTENEFVKLVQEVNRIRADVFYIVDSFGMMKKKDLLRLVKIADKNLLEEIKLGFHAHNNLQLAYSNAQLLVELPLVRNIIVDVTVYGMGRGAGNLNAELFLKYLNEKGEENYSITRILNLMDEIISRCYENNPWGYSLPNYLSAVHMTHPNYATYLNNKKTLIMEEMDEIFCMMDSDKKIEYDMQYIEKLYDDYIVKKKCKR